jgi:glycosyltransferase involved in cell wall biosynthesis
MKTWREQYLYRYGLYHADKIIVQTNRQQAMLHDGFKLNAIVAKMPCLGPSDEEYQNAIKSKENKELRILWVGRISREKQAEIFLTAAEYLPQLSFDLVGGTDQDADYTQAILTKAGKLPNVKIHGKVPRKNMPDVYKNASLLCCTSRYEGFPNTFLEGWSYGLPIISTVDPDNLIDSEKLGYVVKDSEQLKSALVELSSNPILLKQFSERSRIYYRKNHKLDQAMAVFLDIFAAAAQR